MKTNDQNPLIYNFSWEQLKAFLKQNELPVFAADQIFNWIYKKFEFDVSKWSNLSQKSRDFLTASVDLSLPKVVWQAQSTDKTRKFLLKMADGESVEAVVIYGKGRQTLCLSTQVGCAMGCTFCHTGTQGLKRNLLPGEIVGQFLAVTQWLMVEAGETNPLTNIVYMGQGEPLHNFENVKVATLIFLETKGLGLSQRKITLSTSGLVPQIMKLVDFPPVNLAISLHGAKNEVRGQLMPINKVYDIDRLFAAIKTIPLKAYRRITYEYLLIEGVNNSMDDIKALDALLNKRKSKINLIPFNEYPGSKYRRPTDENIQWFSEELNGRGFTCTIRASKGPDILAACGQLKSEREKINLWQLPATT